MSMLAERRQKTRYIIQPGKRPIWKADEEGMKFGKQLMEKMGWTAGKGLGAKEQGISEPIRLGYKNDTKGMGFKENDDNWIQNQEDFNSLLSALKGDESSGDGEGGAESVRESLEEKSKKSRARVHYQKFTRGKDLSKYTDEDLACILGSKKKRRKVEEDNEEAEKNNEEEGKEGKESKSNENTFGVTTINGGSLAEYFKRKWKHIQKPAEDAPFIEDLEPTVEETKKESKKRKKKNFEDSEMVDDSPNFDQDEDSKESSRVKYRLENNEEGSSAVEHSTGLEETEILTDFNKCKKKKKKRKNEIEEEENKVENETQIDESLPLEEDKEPANDAGSGETEDLSKGADADKSKKKKRKKKDNDMEENQELRTEDAEDKSIGNDNKSAETDAPMEDLSDRTEEEKRKKKKKKRRENGEELSILEAETVAVEDEVDSLANTDVQMEESPEQNGEEKGKKKKKKRKDNESENPEENVLGEKNELKGVGPEENSSVNVEAEEKRKRKKKKRESLEEEMGDYKNFLEETVNELNGLASETSGENPDLEGEKRKRKKKKKEDSEEKIENNADFPEVEENDEETSKKRKKKEKRKDKEQNLEESEANGPESPKESEENLINMKDKLSKTNFSILRYSEDSKKRKKTFSQSKILNLVCDVSLDKFKGSNLESVTGYGTPKPKR